MTPGIVTHTKIIGADIIMAFDQCTQIISHTEAAHIMTRTHRWLEESIAYHTQHPTTPYVMRRPYWDYSRRVI